MLRGDTKAHGTAGNSMELEYFLDKQNIVCAMMPAAFSDEEIESINLDCLYDKSRFKSLKQCLNKKTVQMLLQSDAEYLIIDLYDFHTDMVTYNHTVFSTCAHEFLNTHLFKAHVEKIQGTNFMMLPTWIWYPYVDLFFEKIMEKYDSDHIILNRFRSNKYYLAKDGFIKEIPSQFKKPWHSKDEHNDKIRQLEDYIIEKYNPYVIDLSKYYICDENKWDNLNGAHFEQEFYEQTFDAIEQIMTGQAAKRVYNTPLFLEDANGVKWRYRIDLEQGLEMFLMLIEAEDPLWMNVLSKLYEAYPKDERVAEYMQVMMEEAR